MKTHAAPRSLPPARVIPAPALLVSLGLMATTGCSAIGDVAKAGAWVVFVVIAAIAAILFGVVKIFTGRRR